MWYPYRQTHLLLRPLLYGRGLKMLGQLVLGHQHRLSHLGFLVITRIIMSLPLSKSSVEKSSSSFIASSRGLCCFNSCILRVHVTRHYVGSSLHSTHCQCNVSGPPTSPTPCAQQGSSSPPWGVSILLQLLTQRRMCWLPPEVVMSCKAQVWNKNICS